MKNEKIPVILRVFKHTTDVIAIFPTIPASTSPSECMSYMKIGQHGACRYSSLLDDTRALRTYPVFETQVHEAANEHRDELKRIGYDFYEVSRISYQMSKEFMKNFNEQKNA